MKQTNLFDYYNLKQTKREYGRTIHGGATAKGHRKLARPLSTKRKIHLILKSNKAKGKYSLLAKQNKIFIAETLKEKSKKFGVKIHQYANVGTHLHLMISIQDRKHFQKFLISISTLIARHVTQAKRGVQFGKFWQGQAFTRVLTSRLEELNLKGYIAANQIEAIHTALDSKNKGQFAREEYLDKFRSWVYRERTRTKFLRNIKEDV